MAVRADLLAPHDIEPNEIDGLTVKEAHEIHNAAMYEIHNRVAIFNGFDL